jgi:hypothetical protein
MPVSADRFEPPAFHESRPGLVRPVPVDHDGKVGPTRGQVAGKGWRRTSRGHYLPARFAAETPEQRIVEAAVTLGVHDAVTGWAALRWLGAAEFDGVELDLELPVPLLVDDHRLDPPPGAFITAERRQRDDRRVVDGLPVTHPLRSVCFEMRFAPTLVAAVKIFDMAAQSDLVSKREAETYVRRLSGWTGVGRCREAIALGDENTWSRMETEMRLLWREIGLVDVVSNRPVFDAAGNHIGTPDLLDLDHGVVGEYDGSLHLEGKQRAKDIRREGAFRRLGLEYVTMVAADRRDPADFLRRTWDACRRAGRDRSDRWTVTPPAWWIATTTVEQRRALTSEQRSRTLGRRAG